MAEAHRFFVPVGVVSMAAPPIPVLPGETYFDSTLGQLRSWDGTRWVAAAPGTTGPTGPAGPTGPSAVSAELGNVASISSYDGLIYVPDEVVVSPGPSGPVGEMELWVDYSATGPILDSYSKTESNTTFVNIDGDTMTGPLILPADPTGPLEAATKQYVDANAGGGTGGLDQATADTRYVNIDGDTMTGPLILSVDPLTGLEAATKRYVDMRIWYGTQAQYDAILTKDPLVLYCIGV